LIGNESDLEHFSEVKLARMQFHFIPNDKFFSYHDEGKLN